MKTFKSILTLCLFLSALLSFLAPAEARIKIVIDEASAKKFPVALPKFLSEKGSGAGGLAGKVYKVINKDLQLTGLLRVVDDSALPQRDKDVEKINYTKWSDIEVGALIKGVTKKVGDQKVLQLRLYDVGSQKMILGKQYSVNGKNYVDVAHRFVDLAMKGLTGYEGPFSSKIAASCGKNMKKHIYYFEMDGERGGRLTRGGVNNVSPAWAPDGNRIAYTNWNTGNAEVWVSGGGSGPVQVTNFGTIGITPAWAPDGNSLYVAGNKNSNTDIYLVSASGGVLRRVTSTPNIEVNPTVSPDGRLVYSSEQAGDLHLFQGGTRLTFVGYQNDMADWAPDGSKITFASRDQGAFDVFVMDADGSNIVRLTRGEGNNEAPTWSPDSRYIAYTSTQHGIVVTLDDGEFKFAIPKSKGCHNLDWGPRLSQK